MISSQYNLLGSLDYLHWSLSSNHQSTPVSRSLTALFGTLNLTCGTNFLLLFVFLISLVHHHHPALYHHALILDRLLAFFVLFSALLLKPVFSQNLSLHSHLSFPWADLLEL